MDEGRERHESNHAHYRRHLIGIGNFDESGLKGLHAHQLGRLAELAVAAYSGRPSPAVVADPSTLAGDVGWWQVRATVHRTGRLLLRPWDKDDAAYILVRLHEARAGIIHMAGWQWGMTAKDGRWLSYPPGTDDRTTACYLMPNVLLTRGLPP